MDLDFRPLDRRTATQRRLSNADSNTEGVGNRMRVWKGVLVVRKLAK